MNRQKRQKHILNAALKVFAGEGYAETSVGGLVTAATMSRGTFYLYFKNKTDVMAALIESFDAELRAALSVWRLSELSLSGGLMHLDHEAFIGKLAECARQYAPLAKLIFSRQDGLEEVHIKKVAALEAQVTEFIKAEVSHARSLGLIKAVDAEMISRCLYAAIKDVILRTDHTSTTLCQEFAAIFEIIFAGLMLPIEQSITTISQADGFERAYKPQPLHT